MGKSPSLKVGWARPQSSSRTRLADSEISGTAVEVPEYGFFAMNSLLLRNVIEQNVPSYMLAVTGCRVFLQGNDTAGVD